MILLATGIVTSPNYPGNYPTNIRRTEKIKVAQGLVILLQFTAFNIEHHPACSFDHLKIVDGDGTILLEKSCGSSDFGTIVTGGQSIGSSLPADITSKSNSVNLIFTSNGLDTYSGWSLNWSAVTPGECGKCWGEEKQLE